MELVLGRRLTPEEQVISLLTLILDEEMETKLENAGTFN